MTNSIPPAYPTSVPGVYATREALPLASRFLSCDHAAQLLRLESFIKPILIDAQNLAVSQTITNWDCDLTTITSAEIIIAEKDLQTTMSLRDLALEIFNARRTSHGLYREASLGNVGMDSYARRLEEDEWANTREHFQLIKQCGSHWKMSPAELETYTWKEKRPLEVHLFFQEIECHSDIFRQEWIGNSQKTYCAKHPEDDRSCKMKMTDLCIAERVRRMPDSERKKLKRERLCKLLPQADEKVKNDPEIRKAAEKRCPQALAKASKQPTKKEL